jgi:hypothetical protein
MEDRNAYERERIRAGIGKLPRLCIRHYIRPESHGCLDKDGKFDVDVANSTAGTHAFGYRSRGIYASCGSELWPRNDYYGTRKKTIHFTEDKDAVTCKTCLASINKPDKRVYRRCHYAPGSKTKEPVPVCGRNDSGKFEESFSYTMRDVNCPACRRIMEQGRRRPRRPRAGQSDPFRHGLV